MTLDNSEFTVKIAALDHVSTQMLIIFVVCFLIKLGRHVSNGKRMSPIDFVGQRSKVKVTMDIYVNKLVNTIATKLLCAS